MASTALRWDLLYYKISPPGITTFDIPTLCFLLSSFFTISTFLGNFANRASRGSNGNSEGDAFRARCRLGLLMQGCKIVRNCMN